MAAAFTGASRALLASVVFAFEATHQPMGLLPLLAGCTGAYLISLRTMRDTIMTERLARRGTPVITEYSADFLGRLLVRDHATRTVVTLSADATVATTRTWLSGADSSTHQGFPIVDGEGRLMGLLTRRDIQNPEVAEDALLRGLIHRAPIVVRGYQSLRDAADWMVRAKVGRLPVLADDGSGKVVGIISRSDLLTAHERRLDETGRVADATLWGQETVVRFPGRLPERPRGRGPGPGHPHWPPRPQVTALQESSPGIRGCQRVLA